MNFSEKLTRLRKIKGMTQDEFASAVGVTRQAVYKWESGKSYPEVMTLLEIKNLFGVSIDDLLDESFEVELPKKIKRKSAARDTERAEVEAAKQPSFIEQAPKEEKVEIPVAASLPEASDKKSELKENAEIPKEKKRSIFGRLFGRK